MDDRLLWVVPPAWGWAAGALGVVIVAAMAVTGRAVRMQRRTGRVRTVSAVAFWSVAILAVILAAALCLFLLHDRVEFENAVFA